MHWRLSMPILRTGTKRCRRSKNHRWAKLTFLARWANIANMLISHYQHLVNREGMVWGSEAANRGASERLVPILMTALVTGLGLLPLAIYSGAPGNEIEGPMAIVILGGLITSTVLNLLVLPTLALRFGRFAKNTDAMESPVRAG